MVQVLKDFILNSSDVQFLLDQVKFPTIKVVKYDAITGAAIYGYIDASGNLHELGLINTFNPVAVVYDNPSNPSDPMNGLPLYNGPRDYQGLRNVSGVFNNLENGQSLWGAMGSDFMRLVAPDYLHYSKENLTLPAVAPIINFLDPSLQNIVTQTVDITNETVHTLQTVPVIGIQYYDWSEDIKTTDVTTKVIDGHHSFVNQTETKTTVTTDLGAYLVQDVTGTRIAIDGTVTVGPIVTTNALTGGELDTTTIMNFVTGPATAHVFNGLTNGVYGTITNGVTSLADYSNPLASVVDYTPRMITQTISSQAAMERIEASTPGFITEHFTGVLEDGTLTGKAYTEDFISNTNTYAADPPYSGWFVLFGQFFDHGLDFIDKPSTGPVIKIALAVDDPLYGQIGPDGQPVTSITISRATPDAGTGTGSVAAQYHNQDSPYIDQNQTYGTTDQMTNLLREWVLDPNTGTYKPGAALLDGHTVQKEYISTVFSDNGHNIDGLGLTNRTLPTLNELRAALAATGRDDISWEDVSNLRIREDNGKVHDFDSVTAGVQGKGSGSALLIDSLPHFDAAHIDASVTGRLAALGVTNVTIVALSPTVNNVTFTYIGTDLVSHNTSLYTPGNINPADNSITATDANLQKALGEILLESVGDHYIAGDGRANENFGLTTVHHVFHEDHNIQTINLEAIILTGQDADLSLSRQWQVKVANTGAPGSATGHIESNIAGYTGVTYDFANLHYDVALGSYVANLTNIHDSRGAIIKDDSGAVLVSHDVFVDKTGHVSWDNDKLFNAAKLIVEMEYQHVAIDQYARFITPDLPEFVTYDANINADISLEFAQAAFRFGHSQLRETIDAIETQGADHSFDVTGLIKHYALSQAFLNPGEYSEIGPSAIALGMTHQVGNETDEFLTPALQQSLLGQPLDLGAINIARGRDLGIPTLNEARRQLYDALVAERANTAGPQSAAHAKIQLDLLKPYHSWNDFGGSMIHPESLVNFIAAYSFDGDVTQAQAMLDLNAGAPGHTLTVVGKDGLNHTFTSQQAYDFMSGSLRTDAGHVGEVVVAGADGYNSIDLWIGGLAESHVLGGILGATFNAIFEDQMERLMDGDRFYYLYRLMAALPQNTNLGDQVTHEQFKDIVERTTGTEHLNGDIMLYADSYIELGHNASVPGLAMQTEHKYGLVLGNGAGDGLFADMHTNLDGTHQGVYSGGGTGIGGNGGIVTVADPEHAGQTLTYLLDIRVDDPTVNSNGNPLSGYNSLEVVSGTQYNDYIDTGDGDDTAYGGAGNDIMVGNGGSDHLYGEAGNDIIYGAGGTAGADVADFLDGGEGDDYLYGGQNAGATEVLIGGTGNDHLYGEAGIDEIAGGQGDDYIDAGGDTDIVFAASGNDEIYGGEGPDELHGEEGDDLIAGGSGTDKLLGEQGDDILYGGQGGGITQGDSDELIGDTAVTTGPLDTGFDIANYSDSSLALDVAANLNNQQLQGIVGGVPFEPYNDLYMGIDGLVGSKFSETFAISANNTTGAGLIGDDTNNWLVGGSGNDTMLGGAGNDLIVGGSVKLADLIGNYLLAGNPDPYTSYVDGASHRADPNSVLTGGLLGAAGFDKHFTELLKTEARKSYVLGDDGSNANKGSDTAIFTGNRNDYVISFAYGGGLTGVKFVDNIAGRDGTDLLVGIDNYKFADGTFTNTTLFNKSPAITSDGAGATAVKAINENTTAVTTVQATDPNNVLGDPLNPQILTYSISGGLDASKFQIDALTGVLKFNLDGNPLVNSVADAPNFEAPVDSNGDNVYNVQVMVSDGIASDTQDIAVSVNNVDEPGSGGVNVSTTNFTTGSNFIGLSTVTLNALSTLTDPDLPAGVTPTYTWTGGLSPTGSPTTLIGLLAVTNYTLTASYTDIGGVHTVTAPETVRIGTDSFFGFGGSNTIAGGTGVDLIFGLSGNDTLSGGAGNDLLVGGTGNDTINGDAGDDTIVWNAGDGRDNVNGGANTAIAVGHPEFGDRFVINGDTTNETFRIYSNTDDWDNNAGNGVQSSAAHAGFTGLAAGTQIVITRNGTINGSIVATLQSVEEVTINTGTGPDTVAIIGNFGATNLNYNTITVNSEAGGDTIDISGLTSSHRVVANSGTGSDIFNNMRAQDQNNAGVTGDPSYNNIGSGPFNSSPWSGAISHIDGSYAPSGILYSVDTFEENYSVVQYKDANNMGSWDTSAMLIKGGIVVYTNTTNDDHSSVNISYGQPGDNWIGHISSFNSGGAQEYETTQNIGGSIDTMYFNTSGQGDWATAHYVNNADGSLKHYDFTNTDHSGYAIDYDSSATATYDQDLVYTYADQSTYHYHHIKDGAWEFVA